MNFSKITVGKLNKNLTIYILTFTVSFLIFIFLTFPVEQLTRDLFSKINSGGYASITYRKINGSFFSGIKIKDFSIKTSNISSPVEIGDISFNPSFLKLILGKISGDYKIIHDNVKIFGLVEITKKFSRFTSKIRDIDLSKISYLKDRLGLQLTGKINGKADIKLPGNDITRSSGFINFNGENIILEKSTIYGLVDTSEIDFNTLSSVMKIEKGKLKIETFRLGENPPYIIIDGETVLRKPLYRSFLKLTLKLKLNQELNNKVGMFLPSLGFSTSPSMEYIKHFSGSVSSLFRK